MRERPMHRLDCACGLCVVPVEPTWRQAVVLVGLLLAAALLGWWA